MRNLHRLGFDIPESHKIFSPEYYANLEPLCFITGVHYRCKFVSPNSSVVSDTLIELYHNPNPLKSMTEHHSRMSSTSSSCS
jgi:hypothetical protein